jgi:hypothetical protein
MIDSKEISVVIQGPVYGTEHDPPDMQWTKLAADSIRHHLPKAEIILSTWQEVDSKFITYDKLIVNTEPPPIKNLPSDVNPNLNRLICTTANGIKASTREYVLKIRSDMSLAGTSFLSFFRKYQKYDERYKLLGERIIIPNILANAKTCVVNDWTSFGLRSDMILYWDIPYAEERPHLSNQYLSNEQYISTHLFSRSPYFSFSDTVSCEKFFVNNFLVVDTKHFSFKKHKVYPYGFAQLMRWTNHYEWLYLYKIHCLKQPAINLRSWVRPVVTSLGDLKGAIYMRLRKLQKNM